MREALSRRTELSTGEDTDPPRMSKCLLLARQGHRMQKVATTGNATIIVYDEPPLLATDPWIGDEEPAYFGSWVLSHRIPQNLKDDIAACPYIWFCTAIPTI